MAFLDGETDDFNLFAQDESAWADLLAKIPGLVIESAGGAMPYQADGYLLNHPMYFRYRHGQAVLRLGSEGQTSKDFNTLDDTLYIASLNYGDDYDGDLTRGEFATLMVRLVLQLERAPFSYTFRGRKVTLTGGRPTGTPLGTEVTDEEEISHGWGHTAEEAYARLAEPSSWLVTKGISEEFQRELWRLKAVDPTPLEEDNRKYPEVPVEFIAHR